MPYITQRKTYVEDNDQIVMITKKPSAEIQLLTPGGTICSTSRHVVAIPNTKDDYGCEIKH